MSTLRERIIRTAYANPILRPLLAGLIQEDRSNVRQAVCLVIPGPDQTVLAVSRRNDRTAFGLPGGKVDPEDGDPNDIDTLKAAAIRETREETGISNLSINDLDFVYEAKDGPFLVTTFVARKRVSPKEQPGEGAIAWVKWDVLYDGPFGPYNKQVKARL